MYSDDCQWFDVNEVPPMIFDHAQMMQDVLNTLRIHLYHYLVGIELLPEKFTIPEIHTLYETILNKSFDVRNFTKKTY